MGDLQGHRGRDTQSQTLVFSASKSSTRLFLSNFQSPEDFDYGQPQLNSSAEEVFGQQEVLSTKKECTMCGDFGIDEELFRCRRCRRRFQHMYCSRSYPNLGSEISVCNWCLHEEDKRHEQTELKETKITAKPQDVIRSRNNAFEFLLQIAQSLPEKEDCEDKVQFGAALPKETDISNEIPAQKRQRCSHLAEKSKVIAPDKWRQIAKNPARGMGRRYKLLADVLC